MELDYFNKYYNVNIKHSLSDEELIIVRGLYLNYISKKHLKQLLKDNNISNYNTKLKYFGKPRYKYDIVSRRYRLHFPKNFDFSKICNIAKSLPNISLEYIIKSLFDQYSSDNLSPFNCIFNQQINDIPESLRKKINVTIISYDKYIINNNNNKINNILEHIND